MAAPSPRTASNTASNTAPTAPAPVRWAESRLRQLEEREQQHSASGLSAGLSATIPTPGEKPTVEEDVVKFFEKLATRLGYHYGEDYALVLNVGDVDDDARIHTLMIALPEFVHHALKRATGMGKMSVHEYITARRALFAAGLPVSSFSHYVDVTSLELDKFDEEMAMYRGAVDEMRKAADMLDELGQREQAERLRQSMQLVLGGKSVMTETDVPEAEHRDTMLRTIDTFQKFLALPVASDGTASSHLEYAERKALEWYGLNKGIERGYVVLDLIRKRDDESLEAYKTRFTDHVKRLMADLSKQLGRFHGFSRMSFHPAGIGEFIPMGYVPEKDDVVVIDTDGTARSILGVKDYSEKLIEQAKQSR